MIIYTICTCDRCGAHFATHFRAWASVVMVYRVQDLVHAVAELKPDAPLACTTCAGPLEVTLPYAVRTRAGDWLSLDLKQVERAFAN